MIARDSVLFPEPFGPMIAWTSPLRTTRSMPRRISFWSTLTWRPLISSVDTLSPPAGALRRDGGVLLLRLLGELGERHAVERGGDGGLELQPDKPSAAPLLAHAVEDRIALRGADLRLDRTLERTHDVARGDLGGLARERVAATGPSLAVHQAGLAQHRDKLLEVGLGQLLALRDGVQRDAPPAEVAGEIDHAPHPR